MPIAGLTQNPLWLFPTLEIATILGDERITPSSRDRIREIFTVDSDVAASDITADLQTTHLETAAIGRKPLIDGVEISRMFPYQSNFAYLLRTIQNLFTLAVSENKVSDNAGRIKLNQVREDLPENIELAWLLPTSPKESVLLGLKNVTTNDSATVALVDNRPNIEKKYDIDSVLLGLTHPSKALFLVHSMTKKPTTGEAWHYLNGGIVRGKSIKEGQAVLRGVVTDIVLETPDGNASDAADWWKKVT